MGRGLQRMASTRPPTTAPPHLRMLQHQPKRAMAVIDGHGAPAAEPQPIPHHPRRTPLRPPLLAPLRAPAARELLQRHEVVAPPAVVRREGGQPVAGLGGADHRQGGPGGGARGEDRRQAQHVVRMAVRDPDACEGRGLQGDGDRAQLMWCSR